MSYQGDYRGMPLAPQPAPAIDIEASALENIDQQGLTLAPVFSGESFLKAVCYPVIVEGWEKAKCGRQRRRYLAEFTEAERNLLGRYHHKFYRWHLVTGTPQRVLLRLQTLHLLQRAVNFFAECGT